MPEFKKLIAKKSVGKTQEDLRMKGHSTKPRLRGSTPELSVWVDPKVETYVCANVDPGQLRWFREFLRRHRLSVHQSFRHRSGTYTYSFLVPFPRLDRRWHELYRELFEAKIRMTGDLD